MSDIDLWIVDLLDAYTFRFVRYRYLHFFVSKTSWKCLQDMSWRRLQGMSSRRLQRHVFKTSWRRLQRSNFSSSKTPLRRIVICLQDVFNTSWKTKNRYAEDVLKTSSRHVSKVLKTSSNVFKTNKFLLGSQLSGPTTTEEFCCFFCLSVISAIILLGGSVHCLWRAILYKWWVYYGKEGVELQSITKYLRLTLVFAWNSTLQEEFNCYFSEVFCYY